MTPNDIAAIRAALDLTIKDFAKLVGTDQRSVTRWEHDRAHPSGSSLEALKGLAKAISTDSEYARTRVQDVLLTGGLALLVERGLMGEDDGEL